MFYSCKRKDLVEFQERFSALRCHHCGGPIQNPVSEAALAHSMPCLDCGKIQVGSPNPLSEPSLDIFIVCMGNLFALRDLLHPSHNCKLISYFYYISSLTRIELNKCLWLTTSTKRAWKPSNLDVCQMHCRRCNPVTKLGQRQCTRIM